MKAIQSIIVGASVLIVSVMAGAFVVLTTSFDVDTAEESNYTAILMTRTELEKSIQYQEAKPIVEIGKIYKKDSWIFVTEKYKGVHVIDNTNPSAPLNTGFIRVPGCIDISMKNQSMYADNSVDLITIDMGSLPTIKVTGRIKNIFPEPLPPDLQYIPYKFSQEKRPANTIIVEWKKIR